MVRMTLLTALRFPFALFRASRPPGPILLLRDFFLLSARVLPTSIVAFSLSPFFLKDEVAPMDLRVRRVEGSVASPNEAILKVGAGGGDVLLSGFRSKKEACTCHLLNLGRATRLKSVVA